MQKRLKLKYSNYMESKRTLSLSRKKEKGRVIAASYVYFREKKMSVKVLFVKV